MKRALFISVSAAAALILGSCIKDRVSPDVERSGRMSLAIDVRGMESNVATRASIPSEQGENRVNDLFLLFFDPDAGGNRNGNYLGFVEVDLPGGSGMNVINADIDLSSISLSATDACNVLAIANIGEGTCLGGMSVAGWMQQWQGKTEFHVVSNAVASLTADAGISPDRLPMSGRFEKAAGQTKANVVMSRLVARFDVRNDLRTTYDLVSAAVWNAHPVSSVWGEGVIDYSDAAERIRCHYRIDNAANTLAGGGLGDIVGGLYAFENRVPSPQQNDEVTTCLIVGLRRNGETKIRYFRANMCSGAQSLRRNNAYRLTIKGVTAEGDDTEELAYIGQDNKLIYTVGDWELDNNDLVRQDAHSILSIPTKTISIGRDGGEGVAELSVFTFSDLHSPSPLAIQSETYMPSEGLGVRLDGNKLFVDATPLAFGETERRGLVVLSFAGLEISINIRQSGVHDNHLKIYLPDGGIPRFAAYSGIGSGLIRVEASGAWTARLYLDGFSFSPLPSPNQCLTEIKSSDGLVGDGKFRVYTWSLNREEKERNAFIVVSLDSDPDNYSSVVRLSQSPAVDIDILPVGQSSVVFDAPGTGLASTDDYPGNLTDTFNVRPGLNEATGKVNGWSAEIVPYGMNNDTNKFRLAGGYGWDGDDVDNNLVRVAAVGENVAPRPYMATLRITSDTGAFTDIRLVQEQVKYEFGFHPSEDDLDFVPEEGGVSDLVTMVLPPELAATEMTWTATIRTMGLKAPDGRKLVRHNATLVDAGGDPIGPTDEHTPAEGFRVRFPKVYYPNREVLGITAMVTVTFGENMTQIYLVRQESLTARAVTAWNVQTGGGGWGSIIAGDDYSEGFRGLLGDIPGWSVSGASGASGTNYNTAIPAGTTYVHTAICANPNTGTSPNNFTWTAMTAWRDENDGLLVMQSQDDPGGSGRIHPLNHPTSPLKAAPAYKDAVHYSTTTFNNCKINEDVSDSKVYKYLMQYAVNRLTASDLTTAFYNDGESNSIPGPWPVSAVPVITATGGGNSGAATVIIDPERRIVFVGELQHWYNNANMTNNRREFGQNFVEYLANVARYGSHFTDLLIEDDRPGAQRAPWDAYWGNNAMQPK